MNSSPWVRIPPGKSAYSSLSCSSFFLEELINGWMGKPGAVDCSNLNVKLVLYPGLMTYSLFSYLTSSYPQAQGTMWRRWAPTKQVSDVCPELYLIFSCAPFSSFIFSFSACPYSVKFVFSFCYYCTFPSCSSLLFNSKSDFLLPLHLRLLSLYDFTSSFSSSTPSIPFF